MAPCQASFSLEGIFSSGNVLDSRTVLFQKQFYHFCVASQVANKLSEAGANAMQNTEFLETGAWEKAVQSHSWVALHMISLGPTRLISFSSVLVITHYLFQKHLDVSALYTTELCLLERLVNPSEVPHERMHQLGSSTVSGLTSQL